MLADVISFSPADRHDDGFALCTQTYLVVEPDGSAQTLAATITAAIGGVHTIIRQRVHGSFLEIPQSRMNFIAQLDQAIASRLVTYGCAIDARNPNRFSEGLDFKSQIARVTALRTLLDSEATLGRMTEMAERLRAFRTGPDETPDGDLSPAVLPCDFRAHRQADPQISAGDGSGKYPDAAWGLIDRSGRWLQLDGLTAAFGCEQHARKWNKIGRRITFTTDPKKEYVP